MITELNALQQLVSFTFLLTFFGMAAAALFFLVERDQVSAEFRVPVALAGLVCAIAAGNYFYMREIYVTGALEGGGLFPTEFRYIDWFLTVPLMLAQFPLHLGMGRRGRMFMVWLITFSLLMLTAGYLGEINADDTTLHLGLWVLGCAFALAIVGPLLIALRALPERTPPQTVRTVRAMVILVVLGWTIYPLGYLQPALGFSPDFRELLYNVADFINKVGLGIVIFIGGRATIRRRRQELTDDALDRIDLDRLDVARDATTAPGTGRSATDSLLAGRP